MHWKARILSKSRYEPRLRATPRKRVVYEPRALSSVVQAPAATSTRARLARPWAHKGPMPNGADGQRPEVQLYRRLRSWELKLRYSNIPLSMCSCPCFSYILGSA